ncbi:MAG: Inner membrane protein alx [bacterium ADurb.BinA028]|nr:MAG: Inner membrane protein alx [bacterium ADurb.BinA028]
MKETSGPDLRTPPFMLLSAPTVTPALTSIADATLWWVTIGAVVALLGIDFLLTRRPHEVGMREALAWSAFYIAIPVGFGVWLWNTHGSQTGLEYYTGYLVEKSLSVDNLFIFLLLLTAFAVPKELQQRALLIGVAGALVLRGIFIALGTQLIASFSWAFLLFGAILLATAVKVGRDALNHTDHAVDVGSLRSVRFVRRFWPVTETYDGPRLRTRLADGRKALTPMALVTIAILATDIVFAIDSVPAVFGITEDAYLVFATNAFALLGLRALYFVLAGALASLAHLSHGLALILAFIGAKLVLHWAHGVWAWVPEIPTWLSLAVIVGILATVTVTSLLAARSARSKAGYAALPDSAPAPNGDRAA